MFKGIFDAGVRVATSSHRKILNEAEKELRWAAFTRYAMASVLAL